MLIQESGSVLLIAFIHHAVDASVRSQPLRTALDLWVFLRTSAVPYQQHNASKSVDHESCTAFHESSEG